jgi:hypothetical protein
VSDLLAGLGSVLLDGPVLVLLALVALTVAFLGGVGYGRRALLRDLDEKRARVRASVVVPAQRAGEL